MKKEMRERKVKSWIGKLYQVMREISQERGVVEVMDNR